MNNRTDRYSRKYLLSIFLPNMFVIALAAYTIYLSQQNNELQELVMVENILALVAVFSIISILFVWRMLRNWQIQETNLDTQIVAASDVFLQEILNASPDVLLISDVHGTITMVSHQVESILGYVSKDLIGQKIEVLVPTYTRSHHSTLKDEFLAASEARRMGGGREISALRKNGSKCPMEVSIKKIETDQGLFVLSALHDITERSEIKAILQEKEHYFHEVINNAGDPIFVKDEQSKLVLVNDAFCTIFGLARSEIIGKTLAENVPEDEMEHFLEIDKQVLNDGKEVLCEESLTVNGNQTLTIVTKKTRYMDKKGNNFLIGVISDITEYKMIEQAFRESNQKLRELATHQESLVENERKHIAREVHDELGQLLTALKMDVSLLRLSFGENIAFMDKIDDMRSLIEESFRVVRSIASTLRPPVLDLGLSPALEWLTNDFHHRSGISCSVEWDGDAAMLNDEIVLVVFRVVQECLTNVARHAEATQVDITLIVDDILHIDIEDNGHGFDPVNIDKSTGLGLLGIQERILALDGTLNIQSDFDGGTRLTFELPLVQGGRQ